jgi:hypothetical protein
MPALAGSIERTELTTLLRFLASLQGTGRLDLQCERWHGEILLNTGRIQDASLGPERGSDALKAMLLTLPPGSFTFHESPVGDEANPPVLQLPDV